MLVSIGVSGCAIETPKTSSKSQQFAELTLSRDYGKTIMFKKEVSINQDDTVFNILARNAAIETQYGGGFIKSINNIASSSVNDKRYDWLYYVNGVAPDCSAKAYKVKAGDKIVWDYHKWGDR